jgi:hypothetical protein
MQEVIMRCYVLTDRLDIHGPPFPIGTPAYDNPEDALQAARRSGARQIVLFMGKPVQDGRAAVELEQGRPTRVYRTRWTGLVTDGRGTRLRDWKKDEPDR